MTAPRLKRIFRHSLRAWHRRLPGQVGARLWARLTGLGAWRGQDRRDWFLGYRKPDQRNFFFEGSAAGNGSGNHIVPDEATKILRAFREPFSYGQVHTAGFYDDAGFCEICKLPYCSRHLARIRDRYGHCPEGHGKSLDRLY